MPSHEKEQELAAAQLQQNLDDIRANIIANASKLKSLAPRLSQVTLFPPRTMKRENTLLEWLESHNARSEDDIRIQMLYRLRDHAVLTEYEWRSTMNKSAPRRTQDGEDRTTAAAYGKALAGHYNERVSATQAYQAAMRMLNDMVKELSNVDMKIHKEGRETLKMLADTNLKQQAINQNQDKINKANGRRSVADMLKLADDLDA
jgi:hypothetical protein